MPYVLFNFDLPPQELTLVQFTYLMFHWVTGIPFHNELHGGAYDDLTLWEQIDDGEQYTPAKKFLLSAPIAVYVCLMLRVCMKLTFGIGFCSQLTTPTTIHGFSLST